MAAGQVRHLPTMLRDLDLDLVLGECLMGGDLEGLLLSLMCLELKPDLLPEEDIFLFIPLLAGLWSAKAFLTPAVLQGVLVSFSMKLIFLQTLSCAGYLIGT